MKINRFNQHVTWKTRIGILINVPTALCLQQFDKFWIWSLCNGRKRKLFESAETCLEKPHEITSSRLIYLRCLILQATVGDGFQELAGSNQAFGMTHSYSAGPKKRKDVFQCSWPKNCTLKWINFYCLNFWKTDKLVLCFLSKWRCGFILILCSSCLG